MAKMFCAYLTPGEWAVLKDVLDAAIEHFAEYDMTPEELAAIKLKDSIMDSYEVINI